MSSGDFVYVGSELDLFAQAENWKRYYGRFLRRFIAGRVLEVGAGIGGTTRALMGPRATGWTCLEPDAQMAQQIADQVGRGELPPICTARRGALADLPPEPAFDTILYIDVLEHIEDDRGEVQEATRRLAPGGHLVVLAPAHGYLFSPFDQAVGHFRRYDRRGLLALGTRDLEPVTARYFDSVGMLASLANRMLLKASNPTRSQIRLWDRVMVPCSRLFDPLLAHSLGKTVVVVWRKRV